MSDVRAHDEAPTVDEVAPAESIPHGQADAFGGQPPPHVGRYRVTGKLGAGAFGIVFQGYDDELRRHVAIKVPHRHRVVAPEDVESYLAEARVLARLDHPGIVPVYDIGRTADGRCYLVSKFIAGRDLKTRLRQGPLAPTESVELVAQVAEALHHAHRRGLVHRDVKPANILLDAGGLPVIADFGLALREEDFGKGRAWAGTPHYMSPEQARGEGHRVDPRTDVYSLGVVLYELLAGQRPFPSDSVSEVLEQIKLAEPPPPRQLNAAIPRELDRICLKALSKRASDRYSTALDFAEDLRQWLAAGGKGPPPASVHAVVPSRAGAGIAAGRPERPVESDRSPLKVLPRGLRSFEADDADFFLELLPGPRDRDGLPSSVRFWKIRAEETDPEKTFRVGLLYSASGCGKSSLVKAGLLPRLAAHVVTCYLEATATDTEARLVKALRRRFPDLPEDLGLAELLAALRRGRGLQAGHKLLIVLDQFEQWLHARRNQPNTELVQALRQCDGRRVQALVLVRDDFGMAAARFMEELETPIMQGENFATVGPFDARHARKVLAAFGRAFGQLPDAPGALAPAQGHFLDRAIEGLAQDGAIIPVRLALFAEMIKARSWTPSTLKEVGGAQGIGVAFLEETFAARTANPSHRLHQKAAQAVLRALLPGPGTNIKGHVRSRQELLEASGYAQRPADFDALMRILDAELRLVTPIDPEEDLAAGPATAPGEACYQLAHDYLVPALRDWLTRKQKETWRGRAELRLQERTVQWGPSRQRRSLPSLPEYLFLAFGVPRPRRQPQEQALMRAAARHHGLAGGVALCVLLLAGLGVGLYVASVRRAADLHVAEGQIDHLLNAAPADVPRALADLEPLHDRALPMLRARFRTTAAGSRERLHAAFGLAALGEVEVDFLVRQLAGAPASEADNLTAALAAARDSAAPALSRRFQETRDPQVRARLAICLLNLGDPSSARAVLALGPDPTGRTAFIDQYPGWRGDLRSLPVALRTTPDPAFRSGMCAALGLIAPESLTGTERRGAQEALRELYRAAPDGGTHSAAGWALRQWGVEAPAVEPGRSATHERHWFVNRQGMTMLEVQPGTFCMAAPEVPASRRVRLTRPFFICDRETWLDLFQHFIDDPNYPAGQKPRDWRRPQRMVSPAGDYPASLVSWADAVLFCNWLSRKESRRPCYSRLANSSRGQEKDARGDGWTCDWQADGYRLPTDAEWEYACRAGTTTAYFFGKDPDRLTSYAWFMRNSTDVHASPCGRKLPNAWGLFDTHGNVGEWCWDWYAPQPRADTTDPKGPPRGEQRVTRGGNYFSFDPAALKSGEREASSPGMRMPTIGFRVLCAGGAQHR